MTVKLLRNFDGGVPGNLYTGSAAVEEELVLQGSATWANSSTYQGTAGPGSGAGGLPVGGTTGEILAKNSNSDGDAGWIPNVSSRTYLGSIADQATMLALTPVNVGDWCERADLSAQIFELTTAGASTLGNWTSYPGTNGKGYAATSTTSQATVGSGSVAFTTQASLAYSAGARIRATSAGTSEYMEGVVASYSGTTLTVTMDRNSGTGTHADWNINLVGDVAAFAGATLGSGSTNIDRTYLNRVVVNAQAGATTGVFAGTGTSGALASDSFYMMVTGAGLFTASGSITAAAGFKLTAGPGEYFSADYDATTDGFYSTTPMLNKQGANVASATTTVLDTATGDYVHITGTTAITAITLAKGAARRVVFDGILTLTYGASLLLPTAASITTAAGDSAVFVGEAAGVVRCVSYSRADGTALQGAAAVLGTMELAALSQLGFLVPISTGGTTLSNMGLTTANLIDSSTVVAAATTDGSIPYGPIRRVRYQAAASATNRAAGGAPATSGIRADDTSLLTLGRFPVSVLAAIADASPTLGTFAIGVTRNLPTYTTAQPSASVSCMLVGWDETDTNMQVMYNDGAGACTKIDLGASFPRSQFVMYMATITRNGAGTSWTVKVTNVNTGATSTQTVSGANLPAVDSTGWTPVFYRSSLSSTLQALVDFAGIYLGHVT